MRSRSLRRTEWWFPGAQFQFGIMVLTILSGIMFHWTAGVMEEPVASVETYGTFVTAVNAEAWALPLIIGPFVALLGQMAELADDIPLKLAQIWRMLGNFVTGGVIGLFGYGVLYADTFDPLFIYSIIYACVHAWMVWLAIEDMFWEARHG